MQSLTAYTHTTSGGPNESNEFQFFPTPSALVSKLLSPYYGKHLDRALEPSAGRGDIADALKSMMNSGGTYYGGREKVVSVCEISRDLRAILLKKGHRLIGSEFLSMEAPYLFNLIVMNPPFAGCANHVLKAWECLDDGGYLATVLPAAALKRTDGAYARLMQIADLYGAVEEVGKPFKSADRVTDVECVILRLEKPVVEKFQPFSNWQPKTDGEYEAPEDYDLPAPRDLIRAIVAQYNGAMRALRAYHDARVIFFRSAPVEPPHGVPTYTDEINEVKTAFWKLIFDKTKIGEVTTSGYRQTFMKEQETLQNMEFSEETIYEVLHRFMMNKGVILEQCVMDVFSAITKYSMENVVKSEQWHTNKCHKITPKVIIPNGVRYSIGSWGIGYSKEDFLNDLDKVLQMFGGTNGICTKKAIEEQMRNLHRGDYQQKFSSPNFDYRFYQKGTLHLYFKDTKALEMINQFAAERRLFTLGSGK